jgi:zinc/manganese transport system permease protein
VLARLNRSLLLARFFPEFHQARGLDARPGLMLFDLLAGVVIALATVSIGVMAAFALVFVPPLVAYRFGRSWRAGLGLAAAIGTAGYTPHLPFPSPSTSRSVRFVRCFWLSFSLSRV